MKKRKSLKAFAFQNQYGWMNAMRGPKWNQLLSKYKSQYKHAQNQPLAQQFEQELRSQPSYTASSSLGQITYEMRGFQTLVWSFHKEGKGKEEQRTATDIDIDGDMVWAVEDHSEGAEQYTVCMYEKGEQKWALSRATGPFVATVKDRCYVIETENFLWMRRLVSVNTKTGKDRRVELDIKDPQWNLQLVKGVNECLFAVANNAGVQRCWVLKTGGFEELTGYEAFVPVGYLSPGTKSPCYFGRKKGSDRYEAVNCKLQVDKILSTSTPEWFDPKAQLLGTKQFGKRTVWNTKTGSPVFAVVGNIDTDTLGSWRGGDISITVQEPGSYRQSYEAYASKQALCPYAKQSYHTVQSRDGTSVPYIVVSNCKPKYLLCIVYGAYGVPSRMNTDRWKPLLDRGWCISFALVRGSGDHTDAWAEAGRRGDKLQSIEDFEACIRASQRQVHLSAKETVVYGRSAGGYTVGATLSRHANGDLFQGVYTEVPYVDVLNTTSNPVLPLTKLEYNEFGNPNRLENAQALVQLSPIDSLPETGAPQIFVLSRTGLQDKEVYAYESVKWITKLQELDQGSKDTKPKLLAFEEKEGHFAPEATGTSERANDMAILYSWVARDKKSHERIYPMANTRKNNMTARKNNVAMRKRRNNMTARKNNVAMGGKRRRSATRKSTRRNRRR